MLSPVTEEYNDPHLSIWFIKGTAFLITYCDL